MLHDLQRALVVVYGATGYVGRLICHALRRKSLRFAIAGRCPDKLVRLAEELGGGVETCVVDAASPESIRRAIDRRLIVCACAGPFGEVGEPMLAACAELGVHYVDVSDEQSFAARAVAQYDAAARASKACVVPSMGFHAAPADWAAELLASRLGTPLDALYVAYVVRAPPDKPATSRGAKRSAVAALARGDAKQYVEGALRPERDGAVVRTFETLGADTVTATSFGGVEALLVPLHVPVRELRAFRVTTPFAARARQVARALYPLAARAARGAIDRLLVHASEGPDAATRAATRFEIVVEAVRGDTRARVHLTGRDPYEVTAEIQAHAVEAAIRGYVTASGVVAPSVGYPALAAFAHLAHAIEVTAPDIAPRSEARAEPAVAAVASAY